MNFKNSYIEGDDMNGISEDGLTSTATDKGFEVFTNFDNNKEVKLNMTSKDGSEPDIVVWSFKTENRQRDGWYGAIYLCPGDNKITVIDENKKNVDFKENLGLNFQNAENDMVSLDNIRAVSDKEAGRIALYEGDKLLAEYRDESLKNGIPCLWVK